MGKIVNNMLSNYGYNIVALPKAGIQPLVLLYKNGNDVSSLESNLSNLFKIGEKAPPEVVPDDQVSDIQGSAELVYDANTGISVLSSLLEKLKMGKLAAKLELDATSTVTISYQNITEDKVDLLELDNYISTSNPSVDKFNTYKKMLENSELYVINSVLKSNAFTLTVTDKNGQHVDVEGTVKGVLEAKVDFTRNKNNSITLKHENEKPVVFAFKAKRIIYDDKKWWQFFRKEDAFFRIKDQQGVILKDESEFPTQPLNLNDTTADI
ncbi:MAG TPA: hypothetical protein VD993_04880 [Chitinophagaceae bacterium]|nr:hypothetical protein [Chitinophagaceae bacterium]